MTQYTNKKWFYLTPTDAGCDNELIQQFMDFLKTGRKEAGLSLLAKHRRFLLDCYHADQKRIDCLDYLLYTMKENQ